MVFLHSKFTRGINKGIKLISRIFKGISINKILSILIPNWNTSELLPVFMLSYANLHSDFGIYRAAIEQLFCFVL